MNALIVLVLRGLLLILVYIFIGWIGFTIYLDLRSRTKDKDKFKYPAISLTSVSSNGTHEKQFQQHEILIGRDSACDFVINRETISLRHCKVFHRSKQWWVEDLDSTNGTFLNDSQLRSATVLTEKDVLRLGSIEISVDIQ